MSSSAGSSRGSSPSSSPSSSTPGLSEYSSRPGFFTNIPVSKTTKPAPGFFTSFTLGSQQPPATTPTPAAPPTSSRPFSLYEKFARFTSKGETPGTSTNNSNNDTNSKNSSPTSPLPPTPASSAVRHRGKMICGCLHASEPLSYPLLDGNIHLNTKCTWSCCSKAWNSEVCNVVVASPAFSPSFSASGHSGKMVCGCLHNAGALSFPLPDQSIHLNSKCQWTCCSSPWNSQSCLDRNSSSVPSSSPSPSLSSSSSINNSNSTPSSTMTPASSFFSGPSPLSKKASLFSSTSSSSFSFSSSSSSDDDDDRYPTYDSFDHRRNFSDKANPPKEKTHPGILICKCANSNRVPPFISPHGRSCIWDCCSESWSSIGCAELMPTWACPRCSLINDDNILACLACLGEKPHVVPALTSKIPQVPTFAPPPISAQFEVLLHKFEILHLKDDLLKDGANENTLVFLTQDDMVRYGLPLLRARQLMQEIQEHFGVRTNGETYPGSTSSSPDPYECKVCLDKKINAVYLPCAHAASCYDCANDLRGSCPICRQPIESTIRIFFA